MIAQADFDGESMSEVTKPLKQFSRLVQACRLSNSFCLPRVHIAISTRVSSIKYDHSEHRKRVVYVASFVFC